MDTRFNQPLQLDLCITVSSATVGKVADVLHSILHGSRARLDEALPVRNDELLLDLKATAKLLTVSDRTVFEMARKGMMPGAVRLGRSVRWRRAEVEAWVTAGCPLMENWEYPSKQSNG